MSTKFSRPRIPDHWGLLLFGGIWFIVGAPFLCIGLVSGMQTLNQFERLQKAGQVVDGTVITRSIKRPSSKSGRASPQYWVSYRFLAPHDGMIEGEAQVEAPVWDRLAEGGPIRVTHLVEQAQVHQVEGQVRDLVFPVVFTALGSILTSLGGCVLLRGWRQFRRRPRVGHRRSKQMRHTETTRSQPQQPQEQRQPGGSKRGSAVTAATPPVAKKSGLLQGIRNLGCAFVILLLAHVLDELFQLYRGHQCHHRGSGRYVST